MLGKMGTTTLLRAMRNGWKRKRPLTVQAGLATSPGHPLMLLRFFLISSLDYCSYPFSETNFWEIVTKPKRAIPASFMNNCGNIRQTPAATINILS